MSEVKIFKTKCPMCKILSENKVRLKPATTFENNETEFDFNTDVVVNNIVYIKANSNPLGNKADIKKLLQKNIGIQNLNRNGATFILTLRSLKYDLYEYKGLKPS